MAAAGRVGPSEIPPPPAPEARGGGENPREACARPPAPGLHSRAIVPAAPTSVNVFPPPEQLHPEQQRVPTSARFAGLGRRPGPRPWTHSWGGTPPPEVQILPPQTPLDLNPRGVGICRLAKRGKAHAWPTSWQRHKDKGQPDKSTADPCLYSPPSARACQTTEAPPPGGPTSKTMSVVFASPSNSHQPGCTDRPGGHRLFS